MVRRGFGGFASAHQIHSLPEQIELGTSVSESNGNKVRKSDVNDGYTQMYNAERDLCEGLFRQMPESQRLDARPLASEPTGVFTAD